MCSSTICLQKSKAPTSSQEDKNSHKKQRLSEKYTEAITLCNDTSWHDGSELSPQSEMTLIYNVSPFCIYCTYCNVPVVLLLL